VRQAGDWVDFGLQRPILSRLGAGARSPASAAEGEVWIPQRPCRWGISRGAGGEEKSDRQSCTWPKEENGEDNQLSVSERWDELVCRAQSSPERLGSALCSVVDGNEQPHSACSQWHRNKATKLTSSAETPKRKQRELVLPGARCGEWQVKTWPSRQVLTRRKQVDPRCVTAWSKTMKIPEARL